MWIVEKKTVANHGVTGTPLLIACDVMHVYFKIKNGV